MIQHFGQKSTAANLGLQHVKMIAIEALTSKCAFRFWLKNPWRMLRLEMCILGLKWFYHKSLPIFTKLEV